MEEFTQLVTLMDILRGDDGCPWDKEQTRETLKPMMVEEVFEVIEAMDHPAELCEELGDLLFQIVFHARIARENGEFDMRDVVRGVYQKMVRRHPHIFGGKKVKGTGEVLKSWEEIKRKEKPRAGKPDQQSLLDGIPKSLPALYTALQLTSKAARVGFDWPDANSVIEKMREELAELEEAQQSGDPQKIAEELGDIFFVAVNVARKHAVDPETALSRSNQKFQKRFRRMEQSLKKEGVPLGEANIDEMEAHWQEAKRQC